MRPPDASTRAGGRLRSTSRAILWVLTVALALVASQFVVKDDPAAPAPAEASVAVTTTEVLPQQNNASTTTTSTTSPAAEPAQVDRFVVQANEVAPAAKQLAADIAYDLTNYESDSDHALRLAALGSSSSGPPLAESSDPLTVPGSWSRGSVIYPQLGGLTADKASVMVVIRQTVGIGPVPEWSVLRTLDIRLVRIGSEWEFDHLSSAGGAFESIEDLSLAHEVASDVRIDMPDSARLDILSGLVSPTLLEVMSDLADHTDYAVTVLATGHPHNVFETDRQSHHTVGRAVDIYRIGTELVIDGRLDPESQSHDAAIWMFGHPGVVQVGSPWDLDGSGSSRSFTNEVHQDHIHLAVTD